MPPPAISRKVKMNSIWRTSCATDIRKRWNTISNRNISVFSESGSELIIGVIFENLTVSGFGGAKYYIKTFPDAFIDFFNLWGTFKSIFGKKKCTEFDILKACTGCVRPGEVSSLLTLLILDVAGSWCPWERMYDISSGNGESTNRLYKCGREC